MASELFETQDMGNKFDTENKERLTGPIVNGFILYIFKA